MRRSVRTAEDRLARSIERVVRNGNCSGCAGCTLVSNRVSMNLDPEGFLRPAVEPLAAGADLAVEARARAVFRSMCPGVRLAAPRPEGSRHDEIFGSYFSVWEASAVDPVVRDTGSSGGVLTALSAWLIETGQVEAVLGAGGSAAAPITTVPVRITSRPEALAAAGSRYAPVGVLCGWRGEPRVGIVAKPCEVSAAAQHHSASGAVAELPIMLSFFCAGTPSQHATDGLVQSLGIEPGAVSRISYRGNGWPGRFTVDSGGTQAGSLSYEESWGDHLGRALQWRCKTCVDGTGAHADISVGDFWRAGANGYPTFSAAPGTSAAIARTVRGDAILHAAALAGVIALAPLNLAAVARVQPLQVQRRTTMIGRLCGRLLAGKAIPVYRNYGLGRLTLAHPRANAQALVGTFLRTTGLRGVRRAK